MLKTPRPVPVRLFGAVLALVLVCFLFGCSEDGGVDPPPVTTVQFEPPGGAVLLGTFEVLRVQVQSSDGSTVEARFLVDGSEVATGSSYDFVRESEGNAVLRAEVSVGGKTHTAEWSIEVSTAVVDPVPTVQVLRAVSGEEPGTIEVGWNAPPASLVNVPLQDYVVSWSTSPLDAGTDLDALPSVAEPHDGSAISQSVVLSGLAERELHYVTVRTRDVLARFSASVVPDTCEATGHYDLSGFAHSIDLNPGLGVRPVQNVLLDVEGRKVLTDASGAYSLMALSDLRPQSVLAEEESGAIFYQVLTQPQPPATRTFDLLMLPRELVEIRVPSGADSTVGLIDYVRTMTHNDGPGSKLFFPWAQYPIPVHVHDYVYPDGSEGPVDYAAAFEYAVATWNEVAGEELFRIVRVDTAPTATDPLVGVYYAPDYIPVSNSNLGEVKVTRPAQGDLYETVPEWLVVHLRSNFVDDWVARYVITHELGHTLGLAHSDTLDDIMYFAVQSSRRPADPRPSVQEAFVARFLRHVGSDVDSTWYVTPEQSGR